ncbi:MAG: HAD-IC family P-type ATPase, partial [Chloroflexota bacterium]|nr:HAD-IC family P-type ATPase [Chloroflexota bacterium]
DRRRRWPQLPMVAALARQAGLSPDIQLISGLDLAQMDEPQFSAAAAAGTIYGRITPQQKEHLVRALRQQGHYVAMIGDGVNDVLSLKQADLGIAMQSGSQATRGVADIVLMQDSFAAPVPATMPRMGAPEASAGAVLSVLLLAACCLIGSGLVLRKNGQR